MKENHVALEHHPDDVRYPDAPFDPGVDFPELSSLPYRVSVNPTNRTYGYVRSILHQLELDKEHFGTPNWEPFKDLIKPGQHAVIKPNFVRGRHLLGRPGVLSVITHASLMRPIIDYILLSTKGQGIITIADCILQSSIWEEVITESGAKSLVEFYRDRGVTIELIDLRREISTVNEEHVITHREFKDRDPRGYAVVNVGTKSALMPIMSQSKRLMITDYDKGTVSKHHHDDTNEYYIAKTILSADLFINIPKLKTHRKAGITVAMKNLIGINGDKRWIAHHREGLQGSGGDEFPRIKLRDYLEFRIFVFLKRHPPLGVWLATFIRRAFRFAWRTKLFLTTGSLKEPKPTSTGLSPELKSRFERFQKKYPGATLRVFNELYPLPGRRFFEGSWYGNDTVWRTVSDLNDIIFNADKTGQLHDQPQRNYFCLVDGIIGGDHEGPMECVPKESGVLLGGFHPLAVDYVAANIMGLDWTKMPTLREVLKNPRVNFPGLTPASLFLSGNVPPNNLNLGFVPSANWIGHLERTHPNPTHTE